MSGRPDQETQPDQAAAPSYRATVPDEAAAPSDQASDQAAAPSDQAVSPSDEAVASSRSDAGAGVDPAGRRPSPGPSPTSRARRVAAAGVEERRPSPRPRPAAAEPPVTTAAEPAGTTAAEPRVTTAAEPVLATQAEPETPAATEPRTPPAAEPGASRPASRAPLWLAVLLAVLVLAGVAAVVVAATRPSSAGSVGERDRALAAAKSEVPLILSYDYAHFDADVAKAKAQLTGRAVTDYTTAMTQTIKPAAIKVKAVVQAETDGAGVESVAPDGRQLTVVVFGEQKVTNTSLSAPRTDLFRVRATLDLVGGQWLVSKFDQI